jgi:hypothetical protein
MPGSGFVSGVSGQGRVEDLGSYLLVFKRRMKFYDSNPDDRFYAPHLLIDVLNPRKAGPFHEEVKIVREIIKEEIRWFGKYHSYLEHIINKQFDPLVDYDEGTARFHLRLIRDLLFD